MSANNWKYCPKCTKELKNKIKRGYGNISEIEYQELLTELEDIDETLREDWEIYSSSGYLNIEYSCHCDVCGYDFRYNHTEKMP